MIESLEAQGLQLAKEKQEYLGKHEKKSCEWKEVEESALVVFFR